MSATADEKMQTGTDLNAGSSVGKPAVNRSKLPPPPLIPPSQSQDKAKVDEKETEVKSPANEVTATNRVAKPHVPKKPQVPPDKPALPKLSPVGKTTTKSPSPKKNLEKPSPPQCKPKLADLKKKSSLDDKTDITDRSIDGHGASAESVASSKGRDIGNGSVFSDNSPNQGSRPLLGSMNKARDSFNLKVALQRAAERKAMDDKRLTPPRKFVPSTHTKRLSSQSFSVSSGSKLDSYNTNNKSSGDSSDDTKSNSGHKMSKPLPSPSFGDRIKFWGKNTKSPSSPTSPGALEIQSKKSKKGVRQRKPSAKFYTGEMDEENRSSQVSVSSNGSSTFYVNDNEEEEGSKPTEEAKVSVSSDDLGISFTNLPDQPNKESPPKNNTAKLKPVPPLKKPFLQPKVSAISDQVFSDSPPLPRKKVSNISVVIRDSIILPHADDTPVAPVRKKKSRRPGPLQLTMDSSRDSSVERDVTGTPSKRTNSTSFTTDDLDIFQRSKSPDYDLEEKETTKTPEENVENDTDAPQDNASTKSLRRPGSGRVRDKEKRRSKSVGAPGFNFFGVKLKKVMSPTAEKPESESSNEEPPQPPFPNWLHGHMSPEKLKQNMDVASGVYDNNFSASHRAERVSTDNRSGSQGDSVYESIDDEDLVVVPTQVTGTSSVSSGPNHSSSVAQDSCLSNNTGAGEITRTGGDQISSHPVDKQGLGTQSSKGVPLCNLTITVNSPSVVEHEYADIDSPISSLPRCKSIENLYDDVCDVATTGTSNTSNTTVSGPSEKHPPTTHVKPNSPLRTGHKLLDVERGPEYSSQRSDALQVRLERKLSRKLSRKVSRKLSRKLTKKFRENKYAKLKQLLAMDQDSDEEIDGDVEELAFSETDSEFDDDSFSDDSDMEFEQELLTKLAEDPNSELAEIYAAVNITPMTKVQRIANELLTTERSFVEKLELLDQKFHFTIVLENRSQKMFPDEVIPQMFSNIKSIYQFHHDFLLPQLDKRMKEWEETPKIGDVMKRFAPFLKLYTEYVQNFDNANAVITSWLEKSPKFAALLDKIQRLPESGHLTLLHHMLGPIQRVPRYEMLLKDYLKNLSESSDDIEDTQKALELVTRAAQHSNETMRKNAKFRKLLDLNQALGSTVNLVSPTRELIKEGKITKIAARNGLSQERYIFLFNDKLLLCQSVPVTLGIIQQYKIKLFMDIDGMQVLEGDNLEIPNTFYVKSKQRILEFHTESSEEKLEWQMTLWNVITDFTKKMQSRGEMKDLRATYIENDEDLGKRAPKWIKDQETSQCMLCATQFTIIKRRHHCRACGKVVCGRCSDFEARLAYDNNKSKRVCSECYTKLDKSPGTIISSPTLTQPLPRRKGILNVKASDPSVISGYLHMTQDKKNWQRRYFAVHQDFVLFSFKAHQDIKALTSMPLPGYVLEEIEEADGIDKTHGFKVSHKSPTGQKTYFFQADDKETKQKWMDILQHVVMAELPPQLITTERSTSVLSDTSLRQSVA